MWLIKNIFFIKKTTILRRVIRRGVNATLELVLNNVSKNSAAYCEWDKKVPYLFILKWFMVELFAFIFELICCQ